MPAATDLTFYEDEQTPGGVIVVGDARRPDGKREGYVSTDDRAKSPVS
jgi:hypothetical protein